MINYYFGYINPLSTDKMILLFNEELKKQSNSQLQIDQFNGKKPTEFAIRAYESITTSITRTAASAGATKVLREFTIDKTIPLWSTLPSRKAHVMRLKLPNELDYLFTKDFKFSAPSRITKELKVAPNPFAEGALRIAYHAWDQDHGKHRVLKQFKYIGSGENSLKRYFEELEVQTVSAKFALEYKSVMPTSNINFAMTKVVHFFQEKKPIFYSMEPFMVGEYAKWSNNAGWWARTKDGEELATFSHWTYARSGGLMYVVSL